MTPYLTVKTISQRWGVSKAVVYQMVNDGLLPCLRIGTGRGPAWSSSVVSSS